MKALLDILVEAGIRAKDQRYVKSTPNNLGEALRNWAFTEMLGGHSCFVVREEIKEVEFGDREKELLQLKEIHSGRWFKHKDSNLEMGFYRYWDADENALIFYLPELADTNVTGMLISNECSKDYMWYFQEKNNG